MIDRVPAVHPDEVRVRIVQMLDSFATEAEALGVAVVACVQSGSSESRASGRVLLHGANAPLVDCTAVILGNVLAMIAERGQGAVRELTRHIVDKAVAVLAATPSADAPGSEWSEPWLWRAPLCGFDAEDVASALEIDGLTEGARKSIDAWLESNDKRVYEAMTQAGFDFIVAETAAVRPEHLS